MLATIVRLGDGRGGATQPQSANRSIDAKPPVRIGMERSKIVTPMRLCVTVPAAPMKARRFIASLAIVLVLTTRPIS